MPSWAGVQKPGTQHERGLQMTSSRKIARIAAGSMLAFLGCVAPVFAQQTASYISFQVPGFFGTTPVSINNSFSVAGECSTEDQEYFIAHGFVRDVSGKITVFDPPGSNGTKVLNMNAAGAIVGYTLFVGVLPMSDAVGYLRSPQGNFTTISYQGNSTIPSGLNDAGWITGYYVVGDGSGGQQGFVRAPNGTFTPFDVPGSTNTQPVSINNQGVITGSYTAANGIIYGFVRDASGGFTSFDVLNNYRTSPSSINSGGIVTGQYLDRVANEIHGFVRSPQGKITTFDPPGSTETSPVIINAVGTVAGYASGQQGGFSFLRTVQGATSVINYPMESGTAIYGLNDFGAVTGTYAVDGVSGLFSVSAFIRVPTALCCSGKPVELTVEAGGLFWDGGGAQFGRPELQEYQDYPSPAQNLTWTPVPGGFTICTLGKYCFSDNGSQVAIGAKADIFMINATGSNGKGTVLDESTGQYIQNASQPFSGAYLSTGPNASIWTFSSNLH
jgi:hypothetical protein